MRASAVFLILIVIRLRLAESQQRIKEGRCPLIKKRDDCPSLVWDDCTCDLDCPGSKKCCLDGCKHVCLDPDTITPSVRNKADVVFIMDSSGSIGKLDYDREKQFVKDLTNVFHISPNGTRASTIIYSDFPELVFDFDTYSDKKSINTAIDNLAYLGNRTRIDKALALALTVFSKSRPSVPRIAFVLTDGKQTRDYDAKPLDIAVRPLHDLGVQVYVIGIGSYIEKEELYLLARRSQDVFFVSSFEKLLQQTYRIVNQIDKYDLIPPLDITADMLFLIDSSSAVPKSHYQAELDFLKKVVELFRISPRYVRAGIIPYGNRAELSIPLGSHATNEAINRTIDSLPYIGGTKKLDEALKLANQTFSQARPLVSKIVIILTHGGELTEPGADLRTPVQALRAQGVTVFVIGIGEKVDYLRLGQIVPRSNMITDESHEALEPYLSSAASYIRVKSDFSTPLHKRAAVVFLIDSSDNVDTRDFKRQREFVISIAKAFKIPANGARASVILYGQVARPIVQFKDSANFDRLVESTTKTSPIRGPRRMDKALQLAVRMFRDHVGPGPRVVVLFTSGPQLVTESSDLDGPVKQLENLGARIYVIAIGPAVPYREVRSLVNTSDDVIQILSFFELQSELHAVGRHISLTQGAGSLASRFMADVVYLMDSSSDVGVANYRRQKNFVKAVAKALNHGEQATRACLVIYSERPRLITRYDSHKTMKQFESAVDRAPYVNRTRRVDKALEYAAKLLRLARKGVPRVMVLITAGTRTSANPLDVASKALKDADAKAFIVAIGNEPNIGELRLVVEKNNDIFAVPSFASLPRIEGFFPKYIIFSVGGLDPTPGPTPGLTSVIADIIFLMDSSQTVSQEAYRKEKSFVKLISKHLNVSPGKSRAALITYGSTASLAYPFGNTNFDDPVDRARSISGVRRLDLALQEAARILTSATSSVPKLVVLLTAGNQASGSPSPEIAGRLVRARGGIPFAIMIGREPDENEFIKVAEKPAHVFKVPSFDGMEPYAGPLAKRIEDNLKEDPVTPVPDIIADVVFVMDSSSNVPVAEYKKEKDFVKYLAKYLNVSPGNSRAALVAYGNGAAKVIGFDIKRSLADFETAVENSPYIKGNRRIDRSLNKTSQIMANARPSATKIVVLLTAGKQSSDFGSQSPGQAAIPLLESGVYIYVIAIGQEPDISELRPLVQQLSQIFRMSSYDDLEPRSTTIGQMIIDTSTAPKPITDIDADIIFIMDSSYDVTQEDYLREKTFVKDMARYLNVSPERSRAAVITYGKTANLLFKFGGYGTLSTFDKVVGMAPFVGGGRRIDLALEDAGLKLTEARPYKTKWVILLIAGPQFVTPDARSLADASKSVRDLSDKIYVVAIGNKPNIRELRGVVTEPKDIIPVLSFQILKPQTKLIANTVVKGHDNATDPHVIKTFRADIVFLVDTSSLVGTLDFRSQKQFVKSVAKSLNIGPEKSRAAIITYGSTSSQARSSDLHPTLPAFERAVDSSRYIGGPRRMNYAVDRAEALLRTARPNAYKLVVLLTGGKQSFLQDVPLLKQSFQALRGSGAKAFVIAIGSTHEKDELLPAVEKPEDIFGVTSFETLVQQAWQTSKEIAKRTDPVVPRDFQADVLFIMDSSVEVSREDYKKEKDFVVSLAKYLRLSPSATRAALLTYGYTVTLVANYDSYNTLSLFKYAVERASYISGSRRIDKALDYALQLVPNARKLPPKIVVLFTAGRQALGYPLDVEAKKLQALGAMTYIVAIGDKPNINELRPIVKEEDERNVFKIGSFDELQRRALSVAQELGRQPDPEMPDNFPGADVLFLVDSSSGVSQYDYEKEKELIKALTKALNSPGANSRTAFITYGNRPRVVYELDNDMSTDTVRRAIDSAQAMGGGRRTDRALDEGVRVMKNSKRSVPKIVLLITAGRQIEEEGVQPLSSSGRALEETGANSFVLAIGGNVSKQELRPVVRDTQDLFTVKTFEGLTSIVGRLAYEIVQRTVGNTVPDTDVVFVMDSSSAVTQSNYRDEKEAVKSMARSLNVPSGRSRASVITYGSIPSRVAKFDSYRTFSALESAIDRAPTMGGSRRIDLALENAGRLLSEARSSVHRSVVLFTSGRTDSSSGDLYEAAKRIFEEKAELFIIAIGGRPYVAELTVVVKRPEHVFNVSSFTNLERESEKVTQSVVQRPRPVKYSKFVADIIFLVDSSVSVDQNLFNREKAFVKSMVRSLDLSPGKSRVAVISYGDTPADVARFSSSEDVETIASDVESLRFVSGRRNVTNALKFAASLLNKARPSASKVIILLAAGSELYLTAPSRVLREHGTDRYIIAIGVGADEEELTPIIDEPRDMFSIATPQELTWGSGYMIDEIVKRTIAKDTVKPLDFDADLLFLIDSSYDVGRENYEKEKDFVKALAYTLNLSPGKTRMAVIIYSTSSRRVIGFTDHTSTPSFDAAVDSMPFLGGRRRFDEALLQAGSVLKTARPSASKVLILMTAGKSQVSGARSLTQTMESLRPYRTKAFVVAIGPQVDNSELRPVVTESNDIFPVSAFGVLRQKSRAIARDIKNKTENPPTTSQPRYSGDVVFLVDSSSKLSPENFSKIKDFVKSLANNMGVPSKTSRAAVIFFDSLTRIPIRFETVRDFRSFSRILNTEQQIGGGRRMDRALQSAASIVQQGRPSVVILVTGGSSDPDARPLDTAVQPLRAKEAKTFAVVIGSSSLVTEVAPSVEDPRDVLQVLSFDDLQFKSESLAARVVDANPPIFNVTADIVFVMDSSNEVTPQDYIKEKQFVKSMARALNLAPGKSRVAVIIYSDYAITVVNFDDYQATERFNRAVDGFVHIRRTRRMDRALAETVEVLKQARPTVANVVVFLTSGNQDPSAPSLNAAARALNDTGAVTYLVAIGQRPDLRELRVIVEKAEHIVPVKAFDGLERQSRYISQFISSYVGSVTSITEPFDVTADIVFLVDSSSGVTPENYEKQKDFVASLAKQLNFGSGKTRVAVILYNDYARQAIRFGVINNPEVLRSFLDGLSLLRGGRRMDRALIGAAQALGGSRENVRKIVILLTAGQQTQVSSFGDAVKRLKAADAERFVIAIEPQASREELRPVVEKNEDILSVNTFDGLKQEMVKIAEHISKGGIEETTDFNGDVVFLVDSSLTVSQDNFKEEKYFVKTMARLLNVKPQMSRAAVISYGTFSTLVTRFESYSSVDEFEGSVDSAPYEGGRRRMDRAIRNSGRVLGEARRSLPKVVILLTSGPETQEIDTESLYDAAGALRGFNAKAFVVAIGSSPNVSELIPLVSKREDVFEVPSFNGLREQTNSMARKIADMQSPEPFPADVVFLIDSSSDVILDNFGKEKEFVKSVAKFMNADQNKTRVAVISYGSSAIEQASFLSPQDELLSGLNQATYVGGRRRMDLAITKAAELLAESRFSVPKVVVLLTAGVNGDGNQRLLANASHALRDLGVNTYVVAIGRDADMKELEQIANDQKDIFKVLQFAGLTQTSEFTAKTIVSRAERKPEKVYDVDADIVFVVDSSRGVRDANLDKEKDFVKNIAQSLNLAPGKSRMSVILYSSYARLPMGLGDHTSIEKFKEDVEKLPLIGNSRRIDRALDAAVTLLKDAGKDRSKVVILLTAGKQDSGVGDELTKAAASLHNMGAKTFVVAIGQEPDVQELRPIVTNNADLFTVSSFARLEPRTRPILKHIAENIEIKQEKKSDFKADIVFLIDCSFGVTTNNFNKEKQFIKLLSAALNHSPRGSRVAIVLYSSYSRLAIRLGILQTPESLSSNLDGLTRLVGLRRMDGALEYASIALRNSQPDVRKIVVLLTAGPQSRGGKPLDQAAQSLRTIGAETYVVAIGSQVNVPELSSVVKRNEDVFILSSFDRLISRVDRIADYITNASQSVIPLSFKSDILFMMESSSLVNNDDFTGQKNFVKSMMSSFHVKLGQSRAAVITYGQYSENVLGFNSYLPVKDIESAVDRATRVGGTPRLDEALVDAYDIMQDSNPTIARIVVLFSAVRQGSDPYKEAIDAAAEKLHDLGARVYVIAVGRDPDVDSLGEVADHPQDVFNVETFRDLEPNGESIAEKIFERIEEDKPARPMAFSADIAFVVDSSFEVGRDNYNKEKDFVKSLAKTLNLATGKSRGSVIIYSSVASTAIKFDDHSNSTTFDKAVDNLPYLGTLRRMDLGLREGAAVMTEARPGVPRIVVLLTTGRQGLSRDSLDESVKPLKDLGVKVFVVAIGSRPDDQELLPVVDQPDDLLGVSSFNDLASQTRPIAKHIVNNTDSQPTDRHLMNVIFLMDASFGITRSDLLKEKAFVKTVAQSLELPLEESKMAIVPYGAFTVTSGRLNMYQSLNEFNRDVDALQLLSGSRRMDEALNTAKTMLRQDKSAGRNIVILLTAGRQALGYRGVPLTDSGKEVMGEGAEIYVVAIGSEPSVQELRPIVDDSQDIYQVGSFDYLKREARPIGRDIINYGRTRPFDVTADIVIMVDSSAAVGKDNYEKEKEFIKSLARLVNITSEKSRVAVIMYNRSPILAVRFDGYKTLDEFGKSVDEIPLLGGPYRRMDQALQSAAQVLNSARKDVPKIAVLLTAGRQVPGGVSLDTSTKQLQSLNATTLVIAIGQQYSAQELSPVVTVPTDLFEVPSFDVLASRAKKIAQAIKDKSAPKPEDIMVDVVFLVDASSSVTSLNFHMEKKFVKAMARSLNVSPEKSRGSVIVYGSKTDVVLSLKEFTNLDGFKRAVESSSYIDGSRRMDLALDAAAAVMNQARGNVTKIVVLLTAGMQSLTNIPDPLSNAVKPLRELGVQTFVVSIGSEPDKREILSAVEDPRDILEVPSFEVLLPQTAVMSTSIAERLEQQPLDLDADIVFLLDSSSFVTENNFVKEKEFVKALAKFLNVDPESSRASVVLFGSFPNTEIKFGDYRTLNDFNRLLDQTRLFGGSRRMDRALGEATNILGAGRRGVPHIVVLVTTGKQAGSDDGIPLDDAIEPLENLGAHTFVVAIEHDPDTSADVLPVPSFNDLPSRAYDIARRIKSGSEPKPANITADVVFLIDSSTSVGQDGFDKEKNFVKSLAKYLNVSHEKSRAAVIAYSTTARTVLKFTDYQTETDFNQKLDKEQWIGGTRRIDRAVEAAATLLSQARANVPKIIVMVTGGRGTGDTPLGVAAQPLKDMRAKTIVVAVGSDADHRDFLPVVDITDDVFGVPVFDDLRYEVQPIVKYTVKHFESSIYNITTEVVFILDASTTVGRDNFDKQKAFVKLLARSLNVASNKSRAALVTYSTNPFTVIPLGGYSTVQDFESTLDIINFYGGERRMDRALEEAVGLFKKARPGVQRKVILLTSGRQTPGDDEQALDKIKEMLLGVGALPFIVSIGNDHDFPALTKAVENPKDIFKVPSFQDLLSQVQSTAAGVTSRTITPPLQHEYIIFLVDSSSAVKPGQFRKEKDFIKNLAKYLNVGSADKTKAAVVNYGSFPSTSVKFDDYSTLRDFESGVDRITPAKGSRRIDRALDEAAGIFKQTDPSSSKILVLLTSGRQAPESDVTPFDVAIQPLKDMGTRTYVIAIGNEPSTRELLPLVAKLEDVFRVLFDVMGREVPRVVDHIRKENPRPSPKHDFVFLMDSSSDVTRLDFSQEILFVKSLARELSVSPSEFQAAVVAYGNRYSPVVRLGRYSSLREFYSSVDSSTYQDGARRMDRALEAASTMLSSTKPDSQKTVVLLTGGRNAQEAGNNSLERSVQRLREMGAKVIIVAFGNRYDAQELLPVVHQQQDIHPVPTANDLVPYVNLIATYITSGATAPVKQPKLEADVLFVIDSSYQVTQDDYKREKEFIKSLLLSLNMTSDSSRAALITYGDHGSLASRFTGLQSLDDFDKSVDNASYVGGDRRIDKALKMVTRVLNEAGPASSKLVIFLIGGRQASGGGPLDDAVEPLRQFGAKTFVISIGKQPNVQELRPLVSSPEDVVTVVTFKDLKSQTSRIANHISEKAVTLTPDNIVDVVFLVDTSNGVNFISFNKEKAFVKLLAKRLNVSPGKSRAAVIAYGSNSQLGINFDSYSDLPAFEKLLDRIAYIGGTRRIDKALEAAAGVLKDSRPSIPKMVVLLTSGRQPLGAPSMANSAGALHSLGAMVYVVSIANDLDAKYFEVLVEDYTHVSQVPSFEVVNNALSQITRLIEQGVRSRKRLNADVVFLMDASTADSSIYFQSQKDLVKSIMRNLATSADKLRAGLIAYSSSANVLADLSFYTTLQTFEEVVNRATYLRGVRRIDKALAAASQQLSQSRPSAAKIVVLITTGLQAQVLDMTPLGVASKPLRDANANILVIGIGKQPDIRELNLITKNPKGVEIIPSPNEVIINVHLLSKKLRQDATKGDQSAIIPRADLIFLLDSSVDVTPTVFKQQKDFIKSIVGQFEIAPNKTRAAVIRYSSSASPVINFNTYGNLLDLLTGIENIQFLAGGRRLDAALKEANKMRENARPDVQTYVFVLTAGRQVATPVSTPLDTATQPLLDSKARVIVVGIGSQPDDRELRSMAERDRDVFRLPPNELQQQAPLLLVYLATQAGTPLSRDFKADVLFLVDSSQTISKEKFLRELDFVKAFARTLDISPEKSRVSVVTFGSTPALSIRFEDYVNIQSLLRGVDVIPRVTGQKRLDKALVFAARVLSKGRPDANKFLIVVTDGKQPLGGDPLNEAARPLQQIGVKINVIGAGENVNMTELRKITSRPDDLFFSRSFEVLVRQVPVVFEQIISVGPKPQHQVRHGLFLVDASGYRSTSEFAAQIDFIKSIAKRLNVSPGGTRAGVVLYDSDPQMSIGLDDYSTFPEFYALLDDLSLQGGGRELHKALAIPAETLQKSPEAIPKFVVVLVEGQQYGSNGVALLRDAVRPLQSLGITVYIVAIGNRINRQELEAMVERSEHVVTVTGFADLLRKVESISQLIDFTITAPCKGTLDVGFVIDSSGSMGLDNFSKEKNFVKLVSRRIADSSPETRLGLISFSDTPKLFVDFGDFKRMTIDQFQTTTDQLPFQGGMSRIDLALLAASQDFFTDRRSGVPRVLVLVSDGRQSKDPGYHPLSRAVKPLQGQRVKVLAVAFGDNVNTEDLKTVTGTTDNILAEKAFGDLDRLQRELVAKACKI